MEIARRHLLRTVGALSAVTAAGRLLDPAIADGQSFSPVPGDSTAGTLASRLAASIRSHNVLGARRICGAVVVVLCAGTVACASMSGLGRPLGLTSRIDEGSGDWRVSIQRGEMTSRRLLATARELWSRRNASSVMFFLSPYAARVFAIETLVDPHPYLPEAWRQARAYYSRDGTEQLVIWPMGFGVGIRAFDNPVTLTATSPQCRYGLGARCLLRLEPLATDLTEVRGTVTASATLSMAGALANARIDDIRVEPATASERVAEAVRHSLSSWWLDPADGPAVVRITYAIGAAAIQAAASGAEFDLEYPAPLVQSDLARRPPYDRTALTNEYLKTHFRVTASVVSQ